MRIGFFIFCIEQHLTQGKKEKEQQHLTHFLESAGPFGVAWSQSVVEKSEHGRLGFFCPDSFRGSVKDKLSSA